MTPTAAATAPIDRLADSRSARALAEALDAGRRVVATGVAGSSTASLAAAAARLAGRTTLLLVAHLDDAEEAEAELESAGHPVLRLPALEAAPGETAAAADLFAARLAAARRVLALPPDDATVVVAPVHALMQPLPARTELDDLTRRLARGDEHDPAALAGWLAAAAYRRVDAVEEPGEFAQRGGILDVFPAGGSVFPVAEADAPPAEPAAAPVRLDFFGDEIESIAEIDPETMGSDRRLDAVELITADPDAAAPKSGVSFLDFMPARTVAVIAETLEVVEQGRGYFERADGGRGIFGPPAVLKALGERTHALAEINQFSAGQADTDARLELPAQALPSFDRDVPAAVKELAALARTAPALVACRNEGELSRCAELLAEHAPDAGDAVTPVALYAHRGYAWADPDAPFTLVPFHELLHRFDTRRRVGRLRGQRAMDTFLDLQPGDYVVHQEHGIARFAGLEVLPSPSTTLTAKQRSEQNRARSASDGLASPKPKNKQPTSQRKRAADDEPLEEFLTLEFAGSSRLRVPASQIDLVQKYVGGFSGKPPLSTIGGAKWKNQKARVAESVRDLAAEMLRVRAAREHLPGTPFPADTPWQQEFEAEFPYQETEDQLAALSEIKKDMSGPRPMDRLICGDVGFGKTELAIRAAFKACEFGKQVAVLVPTTVLAEQHERTFRQRFAAYPFRVESLSRFKTTKEINATLADVRKGRVDVIIGTHRLLSRDVKFADLGLVVVDEEQRFGVEHKERLLQMRTQVDVITLSATPIPRTLHMSMLGLRDISSLTTPPMDRRAVVTEVIPYNAKRIEQAIGRELAREGQCYFVHNRVHDIETVADNVQKLAPDARIVIGHGQMEPKQLERVMLTFMRGEADILVSTTIIESGIDIPTANTMFINDADRFGLSDLHQLRGRVGRYKHRAYCYLLLAPDRAVKEVAQKRLKALEQYSLLGAGFKIAMRDLEIRGAGNLLGSEQSGHIAAVGYEMYCRLLEDAVGDLTRPGEHRPLAHTTVDLGPWGLIPKAYIPSETRRLEAYRRVATAASADELDRVRADLTAAYGDPPDQTERMLSIARVRAAVAALGVRAVTLRGPDVVMLAEDPEPAAEALGRLQGAVRTLSADLAQTNARGLSGVELAEVYWRPPAAYLEPPTLVRVLGSKLTAPGPAAA